MPDQLTAWNNNHNIWPNAPDKHEENNLSIQTGGQRTTRKKQRKWSSHMFLLRAQWLNASLLKGWIVGKKRASWPQLMTFTCTRFHNNQMPDDFQRSGPRTSPRLGNLLRRMWCFKAEHQTQWMQACVYCWNADWFSLSSGLELFALCDRLLTWTHWNKTFPLFIFYSTLVL